MLEAIVEGGGVVAGLALLLYFQVLRPERERKIAASQAKPETRTPDGSP